MQLGIAALLLFVLQYGVLLLVRAFLKHGSGWFKLALSLTILPGLILLIATLIYLDPDSCSPADPDMCPVSFIAELVLMVLSVIAFVAGLLAAGIERIRAPK